MSRPDLVRAIPARRITVSLDPHAAAQVGADALVAEGLTVRSGTGTPTVVLEYGTATTGLLGGLGLGILPGPIGKHGFAVVEAAAGGGATVLTMAHVAGFRVDAPVRAGIERALAALGASGALLDPGEAVSAHDLPLESAGNPATFVERRYVPGAERWLTS
jgi:hypothetical protein